MLPETLIDAMHLDKKAKNGKLRLIPWNGIGQAEIFSGIVD